MGDPFLAPLLLTDPSSPNYLVDLEEKLQEREISVFDREQLNNKYATLQQVERDYLAARWEELRLREQARPYAEVSVLVAHINYLYDKFLQAEHEFVTAKYRVHHIMNWVVENSLNANIRQYLERKMEGIDPGNIKDYMLTILTKIFSSYLLSHRKENNHELRDDMINPFFYDPEKGFGKQFIEIISKWVLKHGPLFPSSDIEKTTYDKNVVSSIVRYILLLSGFFPHRRLIDPLIPKLLLITPLQTSNASVMQKTISVIGGNPASIFPVGSTVYRMWNNQNQRVGVVASVSGDVITCVDNLRVNLGYHEYLYKLPDHTDADAELIALLWGGGGGGGGDTSVDSMGRLTLKYFIF